MMTDRREYLVQITKEPTMAKVAIINGDWKPRKRIDRRLVLLSMAYKALLMYIETDSMSKVHSLMDDLAKELEL
jgi:hypothetical protein